MARTSWFDDEAQHPLIHEQIEKLDSFTSALPADASAVYFIAQADALWAVLFAAPAARANGFFAIPSGGDGDEIPGALRPKPDARDGVLEVAARPRDAIKSFQSESGLDVTGVFDAATHAKLAAMVHALALVRGVNEIVEVEGDETAVDALFAAASVDGEHTRLEAVALLADLRTARSRAMLGIVMHGNPAPSVRIAASRELARYGDEESLLAIALASTGERDSLVASVMQDTLDSVIAVERADIASELVSDAR